MADFGKVGADPLISPLQQARRLICLLATLF